VSGCGSLKLLVASRNLIGSLRAIADPCDPAHRREWGWGVAPGADGDADADADGEEGEEDDEPAEEADEAEGDDVDLATLDDDAWAARTARRRRIAAAEEEAKEEFGLPDDRSTARALAIGSGIPRAVATAGAAITSGAAVKMAQSSRVEKTPLAELVDTRCRLLAAAAAALTEAAGLTDTSSYEPPETLTIPAAAGEDADEQSAAARKPVLPAAAGAGLPVRGADAIVLERACRAVLASAGAARDATLVGSAAAESAAASSPETEAATLTEPGAYASALALAAPGSSLLGALDRIDLRHNTALADLRELVWLRSLPRLRALDLRGCPVSDEGEGMPTEALIRVGMHLTEVNGSAVTDVQRRAAVRERMRRVKERTAWRREQAEAYAEAVREAEGARKEALEAAAAAAAAAEEEGDEEDS
jgi:hypothetical protein